MGAAGSINTNDEDILKQAREIYNKDPDRFERFVKEVREHQDNDDEKEVVEERGNDVDSSGDERSRVIEEMNFVRTKPHEYAARLEKVASQFKGTNRHLDGSNVVIKTKEGPSFDKSIECLYVGFDSEIHHISRRAHRFLHLSIFNQIIDMFIPLRSRGNIFSTYIHNLPSKFISLYITHLSTRQSKKNHGIQRKKQQYTIPYSIRSHFSKNSKKKMPSNP